MTKLTEAEKKWFVALENCLKQMPKTVEILVHENFNGLHGISSTIYLMKKGVINTSQTEADDLMTYEPSEYSIANASFDGIAANNHGY